MEVLREEDVWDTTIFHFPGFNPCFNGSVERGYPRSIFGVGIFCFNPCFNGSVERGQIDGADCPIALNMFQSLF